MHYRRPGDPRMPQLRGRASGKVEKIHIWAFIAPGFRMIKLFDDTITSDAYIHECLDKIRAYCVANQVVIVHDNAQVHKCLATELYINESGLQLLPIPAHSPDFNMAEHVFAYLKQLVSARFPTRENFRQIIEEEFAGIPQRVFDGFLNGFEGALKVCIRRQGKHFDD
jgi:transposase